MDTVLTFSGVTKAYGKNKPALDNLDLTLPKGKIVGLLGPNGSGKTTFLKLCAGLLTANAGEIQICGMPVGVQTKAVVSYLPDRTYLSSGQSVRQQMNYFKDFYADFDYARAEDMLAKLNFDNIYQVKLISDVGEREEETNSCKITLGAGKAMLVIL